MFRHVVVVARHTLPDQVTDTTRHGMTNSTKFRTFRAGIIILTAIVCCQQVHVLVSHYMTYPTATKFSISYHDSFPIPKIVACVDTDWDGLSFRKYFESNIDVYVNETAIISIEGLCLECDPKKSGRMYSNSKNSKIKLMTDHHFVKGKRKCTSFKFHINRVDRFLSNNLNRQLIYLLEYSVKGTRRSLFSYFMLPPERKQSHVVSGSEIKLASRWFGDVLVVTVPVLSYQLQTSYLLPKPFETDCINYRDHKLESAQHCFDECVIRVARHDRTLTQLDVSVMNIPERLIQANDTSDPITEIKRKCSRECRRPECTSDQFHELLLNQVGRIGKRNSTSAYILLHIPSKPDIVVMKVPALTIIELIMAVANCINLWTAISPVDIFGIYSIDFRFGLTNRILHSFAIRLSKFFLLLMISTACTWQLHESANLYFRYPTADRVNLMQASQSHTPAFVLCCDIIPFQKRDSVTKLNQLFDLSETWSILLGIDKLKISRVSFLRFGKYCTSFHPQFQDIRTNHLMQKFYNITINTSRQQIPYSFAFHSNESRVYGSYESFIDATLSNVLSVEVVYSEYIRKLLPAPYETNCYDYSGHSAAENQNHCIESCVIQECMLRGEPFPLPTCSAYEKLAILFSKRMNVSRSGNLQKHCDSSCSRKDCYKNAYTAERRYANKDTSTGSMITVLPSSDPIFQMESVPTIDVVSFAINFLGCISFWTGLGPMSLLLSERIFRMLRKFKLPQFSISGYKMLITVSCLSVFSYQLIYCCSLYFSYSTINQITLTDRLQYQKPPSFTLCHRDLPVESSAKNIVKSLSGLAQSQEPRYDPHNLRITYLNVSKRTCIVIFLSRTFFNGMSGMFGITLFGLAKDSNGASALVSLSNNASFNTKPQAYMSTHYNLFSFTQTITYTSVLVEKLPYPYDTNCTSADCHDVNFYLKSEAVKANRRIARQKLSEFIFKPAAYHIVISHSPALTLFDFFNTIMNGASFYLSLCPAIFLIAIAKKFKRRRREQVTRSRRTVTRIRRQQASRRRTAWAPIHEPSSLSIFKDSLWFRRRRGN